MHEVISNPYYHLVALITIAVFVGAITVAIGKAKFVTQENLKKEIDVKISKAHLVTENDCDSKCPSSDEIVNKPDCDERHNLLTGTMCRKIDVVAKDVGEVKADIEKVETHISKFTLFMGRVQQYMEDQAERDKLRAMERQTQSVDKG